MTKRSRRTRFLNALIGWVVYPLGDLLAQVITGHIDLPRLVGVALAGGLIYRREVPWWFGILDSFEFSTETVERRPFVRRFMRSSDDRHLNWLGRTLGAILYFNPLWIARHMLFIRLGADSRGFMAAPGTALIECVVLGTKSFLINLPISFIGNYVIQMKIPLRWRFLASSVFSSLLATAYALSYRFLR